MQFTKLRLQGFKSFVDPTELVISKGLTGVVGPNGCGKSNLLEAMRWVMGENRAKAMRGSGMDDVIFAGTDSRPARNSASVELMIDNAERLAPRAFNAEEMIEISRRITRDIGSAYNVNGKTVRARDVQMLFADASTGAHSPALVRQGQIGELINAKPTARRRILEEAAGISGLYQRRHEAELKLNQAETNLSRVEDVLDGLASQLKSLERQAAQARRYREVAEQLRQSEALLLFLRWTEAASGCERAKQALETSIRATAAAETAVGAARRAREDADAELPPLREEETVAAAILQRLSIERDQLAEAEQRARDEIETLTARARQLAADLEREQTLSQDANATMEDLTSEEATLREAAKDHDEKVSLAQDAAREAGNALSEQETVLDRLTEEAARLAARVAAGERRLEEASSVTRRLSGELDRASAADAAAVTEIELGKTALDAAQARETEARSTASDAENKLIHAEQVRADAQSAEAEHRALASEAEGEVSALTAEVQGLERLLSRESGETQQLIDQVSVTAGYEAALGAALGEDLRAGEVDNAAGSGWRTLSDYSSSANLPEGVDKLSDHVTGPKALTRRLRHIGIVDQKDGDRLQADLKPGQRLVSKEGGLWRWDGFRVNVEDASSSAALRLEQQNRLRRLKADEAQAVTARDQAVAAHDLARNTLSDATAREAALRNTRREAEQLVTEASRDVSRADAQLELARGRLETIRGTIEARQSEISEAKAAAEEAKAQLAELDDPTEARAQVETQRGAVDLARTAMLAARSTADDLRREAVAREKRLADIERERSGWVDRLKNAGQRIAELERRQTETEVALKRASDAPDALSEKRETLAVEIEKAETRRRSAADILAEAEIRARKTEADEREAERNASERRETRARLEAQLEAAEAKLMETATRIEEDLEVTPEQLVQQVEIEEGSKPQIGMVEADVTRLRRQRDSLGAVNLRAEEDAAEIQVEHDQLAQEKADLDSAIAKLRGGISELNREGRERLLKAFDQVNEKFARLFRHLFGGGEARLVMVESDDPLDAGLEILCQPPGKKLSTLSLLSGGEQTLTALSLIFAVFLSNPAPICVLDEVDAPLDDSNVSRFCDLLDEMCRLTETRFLIITHHAITMSRMDRLFGVTMVERGVSQLVSVDLAKAEQMVEA